MARPFLRTPDLRTETLATDIPLITDNNPRRQLAHMAARFYSAQPHIVLHTKDNIEITWGAEWGKWQQYLESTDEEKLAKLYGYYKKFDTLSTGDKYIILRDPQHKIPLPIDKYH